MIFFLFFFFIISERENRGIGKAKRKNKRERKNNNKIFCNESKVERKSRHSFHLTFHTLIIKNV